MAANASPETLQSFVQQQAPPAPTQPPVIQPSAVTPDTTYYPFQGLATGPIQTTPEAKKDMEELPDVKAFSTSKPVYIGFADSSKNAVQNPNSVNDLSLAESYSKLFDPQATLREFKFDALVQAIPWLSKFKDLPAIVAREHKFPADVRQAIVNSGLDVIEARENALRPRFAYAEAQHPGLLDEDQKAIMAGVPFRKRMGVDNTAASAAGNFQTLPSGKRVRFVPAP